MNELQLGLIGLGTTAVVVVVVYNKWQEHRHRKVAEQLVKREHADVLLGQERPTATEMAGEHFSQPPADAVDDYDYDYNEPPVVDIVSEPVVKPTIRPAIEPVVAEPKLASPLAEPRLAPRGRQEPSLRIEPEFDDADTVVAEAPAPRIPAPPSAPLREMPEPVAVARPLEAPPVVAGATDDDGVPASLVSPVIDYVARFELVEPVFGDQLLRSQRELLSRISKPIGWAGFNDRLGQWERVVEEGSYRRVRVGLLLADRRGPLGEADLLTFHGAMQELGDELMAVVDLPPRAPALSAAIALDHFCANVDIQIGLNLISQGQVFPGTKIRALAEAAGMVLDSSGRFARCDDDGRVLYTMANQESVGFSLESMRTMSTHGVVFMLDVPCVTHGDRIFAQMLDVARRMADTLHGVLVDDNRRPLTETKLDPFRRQIGQYQAQLAAKGLNAGGALALRLFA